MVTGVSRGGPLLRDTCPMTEAIKTLLGAIDAFAFGSSFRPIEA